jgi:hypothetical protein
MEETIAKLSLDLQSAEVARRVRVWWWLES